MLTLFFHLVAFDPDMVYKHRLCVQDLTKTEHDMYLMGMTMACIGIPTEREDGKERKRQRAKYRFWVKICFLRSFDIMAEILTGQRSLRHSVSFFGEYHFLPNEIDTEAHD